jgi:hypothetical protein
MQSVDKALRAVDQKIWLVAQVHVEPLGKQLEEEIFPLGRIGFGRITEINADFSHGHRPLETVEAVIYVSLILIGICRSSVTGKRPTNVP